MNQKLAPGTKGAQFAARRPASAAPQQHTKYRGLVLPLEQRGVSESVGVLLEPRSHQTYARFEIGSQYYWLGRGLTTLHVRSHQER